LEDVGPLLRVNVCFGDIVSGFGECRLWTSRHFTTIHSTGGYATNTVEKLGFSGSDNFSRNVLRPAAQASDRLSGSEPRQKRISSVLHYPLVSSIRKRAQIAIKKSTDLKTEFFNSIRRLPAARLEVFKSLCCERQLLSLAAVHPARTRASQVGRHSTSYPCPTVDDGLPPPDKESAK
jgi:hypothetical protein